MLDKWHALWNYLRYQKVAKTKYYLHSPFIYQFYLNVLEGQNKLPNIEHLRNEILQSKDIVIVQDFGAKKGMYSKRVSAIAKTVSISEKYGLVLNRAVRYFQPKKILELGTSLGIGTSYLALENEESKVISIEGSETIAAIAKSNIQTLNISATEIIVGNFDDVLADTLAKENELDMAFIDGNHRYEATMRYYQQIKKHITTDGCIILDDIYWSREMTRAWEEIKQDKDVSITIDIYRMGFVFFQKR